MLELGDGRRPFSAAVFLAGDQNSRGEVCSVPVGASNFSATWGACARKGIGVSGIPSTIFDEDLRRTSDVSKYGTDGDRGRRCWESSSAAPWKPWRSGARWGLVPRWLQFLAGIHWLPQCRGDCYAPMPGRANPACSRFKKNNVADTGQSLTPRGLAQRNPATPRHLSRRQTTCRRLSTCC